MSKKRDLELDTGFTLHEWKRKSEAGEFCGILGCFNKPETRCDHCGNWYCNEHKWVLETPAHPSKYSTKNTE